jgi:hypothetical protein
LDHQAACAFRDPRLEVDRMLFFKKWREPKDWRWRYQMAVILLILWVGVAYAFAFPTGGVLWALSDAALLAVAGGATYWWWRCWKQAH